MVKYRFVACVALLLPLWGCSTLKFWGDDEPDAKDEAKDEAKAKDDEPAVAGGDKEDKDDGGGFFGFFSGGKAAAIKPAAKAAAADEHELKLAKLWARVDELEEEQLRQKERLRVLEKGLTLGLVPEELKPKAPAAAPPPVEVKPAAPPAAETKPEPQGLSQEAEGKYQAALASAHDNFRAGRYGRAIVEYSEIGKNFGDRVDGGMAKYWVARCWMALKEYNTARQHLAEFLKEYPGSAWMPRAKLELARVEWKLGLAETALQRFRDIIQQHPYEDAAEMAKMELENLDKTL